MISAIERNELTIAVFLGLSKALRYGRSSDIIEEIRAL